MDLYTFVFLLQISSIFIFYEETAFHEKNVGELRLYHVLQNKIKIPSTFCFLLFEQTLPRFTKQDQNSFKSNKPISVYLRTLYVIFFFFTAIIQKL